MAKIHVVVALLALVAVSMAVEEVKKADGGSDLKTASSYGLGFGYGGYGGWGGWGGWGLPLYGWGWGGWGWGGPGLYGGYGGFFG